MAERNAVRGHLTLHRWVMLLAPAILVAVLVVYPFIDMIAGYVNPASLSIITGNSPDSILTRRAVWNSLAQGAVSAVFSFIAGLPLGLFLGRYIFRLKKAISALVLVPFFLPSVIVVFAFTSGFGNSSVFQSLFHFGGALSSGFTGIVAVNTFFNAPLVALFVMTAVGQSDPSLDEAALTLNASIFRRFSTVWGRDGITAGISGSLLAFMYSFAGFAAPLIIGGPGSFTLDAWIYYEVRTLDNTSVAVMLAFIEALILLVPALIYIKFSATRSRVTASRTEQGRRKHGGDRYFLAGSLYTVIWIAVEIYLLSSIFLSSFSIPGHSGYSLQNYSILFGARTSSALGISTFAAILNSLFYGMCTAIIVVTVGMMWIVGKRRLGISGGVYSEITQYIPLVISAIMMSFAILIVFGSRTPVNLTWLLIVGAQSAVAIPVVLRVIESGFLPVNREYSEASQILRGSPFFEVELPLAGSAFASALMFGFAMSLGEFSATNFLATTHYIPLTVEMYSLQSVRLFGPAYSAASILMIMSLLSFYIIQKLGERFVVFR